MRRPARTARQRLQDILDAIRRIERFTRDKSFEDFMADEMLRDAVERNVERISEASRGLPPELTAVYPDIPWRAVADIGNVLRHAYDDVDDAQTWRVAVRDLGTLRSTVLAMIEKIGEGGAV